MNVSNLLKQTSLVRIEAEILLASTLEKDRSFIRSFPEYELSDKEQSTLESYISRRLKHEPLAYILGYKEFYGLNFFVNQNVLIPRPETENLVEEVLKESGKKKLTIVDVGTGSGCLAIVIALKNQNAKVFAFDKSDVALQVARKNAQLHHVSNIKFSKSDLLSKLSEKTDIIVANLPYIPTINWEKLPREIKDFEPKLALESGGKSTGLYDKLFKQAESKLKPGGKIFYELDGRVYSNVGGLSRGKGSGTKTFSFGGLRFFK